MENKPDGWTEVEYHQILNHKMYFTLLYLEGSTLHELVEKEWNEEKLKELCK